MLIKQGNSLSSTCLHFTAIFLSGSGCPGRTPYYINPNTYNYR